MTIAEFRERYGTAFYGFINSELGRAMIQVLKDNDPIDQLSCLPPNEQSANSHLFLGQVTGWRACILVQQNQLIVTEAGPVDPEANYEREEMETFRAPQKEPAPTPVPPPVAPASTPRRKKKK